MSVVRIKDAPFSREVVKHLLDMGIDEADWGHPETVLEDPIAYFKERIRLRDDPTLQLLYPIKNLSSMRGTTKRDARRKVDLGTAEKPLTYRMPKLKKR